MKQVHYNIDNIDKENALFNLIYGEKSNGKSYQVKHKKAIEHYLKTGKRFILLRRWREDISNLWIEQYFQDVDVEKLTEGRYNCISNYRKVLYFANYNIETGKVVRGEKIGYVMALSTEQHLSSASFLDVDVIIFEEFMQRGVYMAHEPDRLMILYSTIDRKRGTTKLYMVGNSISRVCPYIYDWGLETIFKKLKQGEIATKEISTDEENKVKIAIEYCKASGGKALAIGNAKEMIDKGAWQTFPQPLLKKSKKCYNIVYRIGFQYQSFKFIAELLKDKDTLEYAWFIYPYYKDFSNKLIVFSDTISQNPLYQRDIYNSTIKIPRIRKILDSFRENMIFYSSDLCGTDFKQVIDFTIRR